MTERQIYNTYSTAVETGNMEVVKTFLDKHSDLLDNVEDFTLRLKVATQHNQLAIADFFLERGANINGQKTPPDYSAPVHSAAGDGALEGLKWLLKHKPILEVVEEEDGYNDIMCPGLQSAASEGYLECVRLLVEAGAPVKERAGMLAWELAHRSGHTEIVEYLRSVGAPKPIYKDPTDNPDYQPPVNATTATSAELALPDLRSYLELKMLGTISPVTFQEILPSDPPIRILVLDQFGIRQALVSEGMSRKPIAIPEGSNMPIFAEVVLCLPANWPLDAQSIEDDRNGWPIQWMRRIAHFPHESGRMMGTTITFDNGAPLGTGTRFTALLAISAGPEASYVRSTDGERVMMYNIIPIYPEEMELQNREGVIKLITLLDEKGVVNLVAPDRPSVVPVG